MAKTALRRCPRTDLYVTDCACRDCRNLPDPAPGPVRAELGPWFEARFPGRCSRCATEFEPGDRIRADGHGGYLAECCGEDDGNE